MLPPPTQFQVCILYLYISYTLGGLAIVKQFLMKLLYLYFAFMLKLYRICGIGSIRQYSFSKITAVKYYKNKRGKFCRVLFLL